MTTKKTNPKNNNNNNLKNKPLPKTRKEDLINHVSLLGVSGSEITHCICSVWHVQQQFNFFKKCVLLNHWILSLIKMLN